MRKRAASASRNKKRSHPMTPLAHATFSATEYPYYVDFYVERVEKPFGVLPSDDDVDRNSRSIARNKQP